MRVHVKQTYHQAIATKYHGPTDTKGSRISASCEARRIYVPWDYEHEPAENHRRAAEALARKLDWGGEWRGGGDPRGGYVFVCVRRA
jgi:hypothetical protein